MYDFQQALSRIRDSETASHALIIYGLVHWLRPRVCVEIGAFHGYISCWIARALIDFGINGRLFCVDNFTLLDASEAKLRANLESAAVGQVVEIIEGNSHEVSLPEKIDFAFVDGDHTKEGCRRDVQAMIDHGTTCVVVHDTTQWWGPRQWLADFRIEQAYLQEWDVIEVTHSEGLAVLMRRPIKDPPAYGEEEYPDGNLNS